MVNKEIDSGVRRGYTTPQKSEAEIEYDLGKEIIQADQMIAYYKEKARKAIAGLDAIKSERQRNQDRSVYRGVLRKAEEANPGEEVHPREKS